MSENYYIVMGIDECGTEFRPSSELYATEAIAYEAISELRERYPEARKLWVELYKDKEYYMKRRLDDDGF